MTDSHKPKSSDGNIESRVAGNGDRAIPGAAITDKIDNAAQQRLTQREALKAYRFTQDHNNCFSIDMGDGNKIVDKRPIGKTSVSGIDNVESPKIVLLASESTSKELKAKPEKNASPADETPEARAADLIAQRIFITAQLVKNSHDGTAKAPSKRDDMHVSGFNPLDVGKNYVSLVNAAKDAAYRSTPGDLKQKFVSDLGIEAIPVADLKNSTGVTAVLDHALADSRLDPKHYNCNDYVEMFVLANEDSAALEHSIKSHFMASSTDTPEPFLRQHGYEPLGKGPLRDGDIIVIHGPGVAHSAIICSDPKTHELYTMQKPNPFEMPVRLSLVQLCRAENVANANIEVYRK